MDNQLPPALPPEKPKKIQSSKAQKLLQLQEACDMLCKGLTRTDIAQHFKEKWKLKIGATDIMIKRATKRLSEVNQNTIEQNQTLVLQAMFKQYRSLDASGQHAQAAKVMMDIAKLQGLDSNIVNVKVERPAASLSDEELAEALSATK